jgi:hypothetical protein
MRPITEEEFQGWLADPLTQAVLRALRQRRAEITEGLAKGNFWEEGDSLDQVGMRCLEETAKIAILSEIIELDHETFTGLLKEATREE